MLHFVYERIGFHCLWFFLDLHLEWSLSSVLCYCNPLYLLYAHLCVFALVTMAPVVRVKPNNMKLLDENSEILAKVEAVGWLSFFHKFAD